MNVPVTELWRKPRVWEEVFKACTAQDALSFVEMASMEPLETGIIMSQGFKSVV